MENADPKIGHSQLNSTSHCEILPQLKHTPLPWTVNGSLIVKDCYGPVIADTDVSMQFLPKRYVPISESRSNAKLIVTASNLLPQLVDACALMLREHYQYSLHQGLGETPGITLGRKVLELVKDSFNK